MTKMTDLEYRTMDLFAHCEMNSGNGSTPQHAGEVYTYLWADDRAAALGISGYALGGVLTSLVTKGFAIVRKPEPKRGDKDGSFSFTAAGFEAWAAERAQRNGETK